MSRITITDEEAKVIRSLKRLAKRWPQTLKLFSWSGSLKVTKLNNNGILSVVVDIEDIPNDGGDPSHTPDEDDLWIDTDAEIIWPD